MKTKKDRQISTPHVSIGPPPNINLNLIRTDLVDQLCDISEVFDAYELLEELVESRGFIVDDIDRNRLAATLRILNSTLGFRIQAARESIENPSSRA